MSPQLLQSISFPICDTSEPGTLAEAFGDLGSGIWANTQRDLGFTNNIMREILNWANRQRDLGSSLIT